MSLAVSVDVKQHWTMLRHWWQFVPNLSTDIWGHEALLHCHHYHGASECSWSVPAVHRRSPVRPLRIVLLGFSLGFHLRTLLQASQLSGTPVATLRGTILGKTSSSEGSIAVKVLMSWTRKEVVFTGHNILCDRDNDKLSNVAWLSNVASIRFVGEIETDSNGMVAYATRWTLWVVNISNDK